MQHVFVAELIQYCTAIKTFDIMLTMSFINTLKQNPLYITVREWKKTIVIYLDAISKHYFKYSFPNLQEFAYVYREIYQWKEYEFFPKNKNPVILDCGSHIGISVLYFKMLYPNARITAFEPTPKSFQFLQKNLRQNGIEDVVLVNAALGGKEGTIPFYVAKNTHGHWAWGNSGIKHDTFDERYYDTIHVPTVRLSSFINQPIDLIKMDVEWMELEVMQEIENKLHLVREIVFDFHGSKDNPIEKLLHLLRKHHFSYIIYQGEQVEENDIKKTEPSYSLIVRAKKKT